MLASLLHVRVLSPALCVQAARTRFRLRLFWTSDQFRAFVDRCRRRHARRPAHRRCHCRAGKDTRHSPGGAFTRWSNDCLGGRCATGNRDSGCRHSRSVPPPPFDCRNGGGLYGRGSGLVARQQITRVHFRLQFPCRLVGPGGCLSGHPGGDRRFRPEADPSARWHHQPGIFPRRPAHCLPVYRRRHPASRGAWLP